VRLTRMLKKLKKVVQQPPVCPLQKRA